MKTSYRIACALFAASVAGLAAADKVLTPMQTAYIRRAYVHHQETERLDDGSVRLVRHIYRGATPVRVETNILHAVEGRIQHNPLQVALEKVREELEARKRELADSSANCESIQARHDRIVARITERRDAATLAITKAIYQEIIDLFDAQGVEVSE